MIGIDTNILVRYIVQDDEEQARLAGELIENGCTEESPGFINRIVLCELVWVLSKAYGYERTLIAGVLEQILVTTNFEVENTAVAWAAVRNYGTGTADFSDYLIAHSNKGSNAVPTITFDRKAGEHPLFKILS